MEWDKNLLDRESGFIHQIWAQSDHSDQQCLTLIHRTNSLTKNASLYNRANFKSPTDNLHSLTW